MSIFKKKPIENSFQLVCPECDKNTKVKTENGGLCNHCETPFKGLVFKKKKYFTKAQGLLLVSGAITGAVAMESIENERLAYESEFVLMTACVNEDGKTVNQIELDRRIEQCSCAVKSAVNEIGESDSSGDPDKVIRSFIYNVKREMPSCQ